MARLSRFVAVVALLGGATVSLSGCTGDTDPVVSQTPSATAEVTASPSVSPSPTPLSDEELLELIPEEARAENFGGAVNFARFFLFEYHRMFVDEVSAVFAAVSGDDCEFCASSLEAYDALIGAGGRSEGGKIDVDVTRATGGIRDDGYWYVALPFTVTASSDYSATGELIDSGTGATGTASLRLEWSGIVWVVQGVEVETV